MAYKTLQRRMGELPQELNMSWRQISNETGVRMKTLKTILDGSSDTYTSTIKRIAMPFDYIPFVYRKKYSRHIEDLREEGFLHGIPVENYDGLVFTKHRNILGLDQGELAAKLRTAKSVLSQYENGNLGLSIGRLEDLCRELELISHYFWKIEERWYPETGIFESYLTRLIRDADPDEVQAVLARRHEIENLFSRLQQLDHQRTNEQ